LARGFGCEAYKAESIEQLKLLLQESFGKKLPTVIEVDENVGFLQE